MTLEQESVCSDLKAELKCSACGSECIKHEYRLEFGDVFQCKRCNLAFTLFDVIETGYQAQEDWGSTQWIKSKLYLLSHSRKKEKARLKVLQKLDTGNKLLEFGANVGSFLWVADKAGFNVSGSDLHSNLLNMNEVEGLKFYHADAMTACFETKYDVVVGFQFLEHVDNPLKFLRNLRKALNEGGLLFFEVPNYNSRYRVRDGKKWQHFNRGHFSHFDASSLKYIMKSAGYKVVYQSSLQPLSFIVDPYYLPVRHWVWRNVKEMIRTKQRSSVNDTSSIMSDVKKTLSLEDELKIHNSFKAKVTRLERRIMDVLSLLVWPFARWIGKRGQGDVIQICAIMEKQSDLDS